MEQTNQPLAVQTVPQPPQYSPSLLKPHRGVVVLTLGILGFFVCFICGIIAWVIGNNDLREMRAGTMDPAGEGLTQAGRICGMISVILAVIGIAVPFVILGIIFLIGFFAALASAWS